MSLAVAIFWGAFPASVGVGFFFLIRGLATTMARYPACSVCGRYVMSVDDAEGNHASCHSLRLDRFRAKTEVLRKAAQKDLQNGR